MIDIVATEPPTPSIPRRPIRRRQAALWTGPAAVPEQSATANRRRKKYSTGDGGALNEGWGGVGWGGVGWVRMDGWVRGRAGARPGAGVS